MAPSHSGLYIYVSVQFGEQELKYALKSIQYVAICDLDRHMYVYSECLCQFPVAAARNYQKNATDSNSTHLFSYSSGGLKSKVGFTGRKGKCWLCQLSSRSCRGESASLPFPTSRSCLYSLICGPYSHLQSQQCRIFNLFSLPFLSSHLLS